MNPFGEWSLAQQKALWRRLAEEALLLWGLRAHELSWLGYSSNAVFKAVTDRGEFVLRLHPPGRMKTARLRSELTWLRVIRDNTRLLAPFPVRVDHAGRPASFLNLTNPVLPPPHKALICLFEYIPGDSKPAQALQNEDVYGIGHYLASLHKNAQVQPSSDFERPRLDAEGLFGDDSPYVSSREGGALTQEQLAICREVAQAVDAAMKRLAQKPKTFGLIHADLLAKNILFAEAGLAALDFEYCAWGYFLYDLAPLLWQLKGERPDEYEDLEAAMWAGYVSLRPEVECEREFLETFIAARQLASCRWLLQQGDHPQVREVASALLEDRIDELRAFLASGRLQRLTATL